MSGRGGRAVPVLRATIIATIRVRAMRWTARRLRLPLGPLLRVNPSSVGGTIHDDGRHVVERVFLRGRGFLVRLLAVMQEVVMQMRPGMSFLLLHGGLGPRDQILTELRATLVNTDSMADDSGGTARGVGELAALHPGVLEARYAVDGIEQAHEPDAGDGSTEGFAEGFHERIQLPLLLLVFLGVAATLLPLGKGLPCEAGQFLISGLEQADVIQHF